MNNTTSNKKMRRELAALERRQNIARLYLHGMTVLDISKQLGITDGRVYQELSAIREYWASAALTNYDLKVQEEVARYEHIRRIAMEAWEESKKNAYVRKRSIKKAMRIIESARKDEIGRVIQPATVGLVPIESTSNKEEKGQVGDPRFLQLAKECTDAITKLLKLVKDEGVTNNIYIDFSSLVAQQQPKQIDVIEHTISQAANPDQSDTTKSRLPAGLKELDNS